jgi:hypothetical protein
MGASVAGFWQGMTQEQLDSHPCFFNDCQAWGDWMAERCNHPAIVALHKSLGVEALLSQTTDGLEESEIDWVSPQQMASAATRLRRLVLAKDAWVRPLLDVYAKDANHVDPVDQEFAQDLSDVAAIAGFAAQCGIARMTLEVNW